MTRQWKVTLVLATSAFIYAQSSGAWAATDIASLPESTSDARQATHDEVRVADFWEWVERGLEEPSPDDEDNERGGGGGGGGGGSGGGGGGGGDGGGGGGHG